MTTVVVLGATGELGSRVCRLLRRWAPAVRVLGTSRSGAGLPDLPVRRADVADPVSLREALHGADLAVNAVGPYRYDPEPLLRACIETHCHYADLAEDLPYLARLERAARSLGAAEAGVTVVGGCSTVPGLVQLLASRWRDDPAVASVGAWLSMGSRNPASRGLLAGLLAPLGRPAPDGERWFTRLAWLETSDGRRLSFGRFPAPFPSRGMRLGARRIPIHFHAGFDRGLLNRALAWTARVLGRLPEGSVERLARALLPLAGLLRPFGTTHGVLSVVAEDPTGRERARTEVHAARGGLDVPAAPPVWVARELATRGTFPASGLVGLDRIVPLDAALGWLRDAGYDVVIDAGPPRSGAR